MTPGVWIPLAALEISALDFISCPGFFLDVSSGVIPGGAATQGIFGGFFLCFGFYFVFVFFSFDSHEVLLPFEATPPIALRPS